MSDARFQAIFEHALDPMLIADDDARYLDANPAACEFFGFSRAQLCARRVVDFAPPEAKADFDMVWKLFLREASSAANINFRCLMGDSAISSSAPPPTCCRDDICRSSAM